MAILVALSGFGFLAYSASRIAWSSGLERRLTSFQSRNLLKYKLPSSSTPLPCERLIIDDWREVLIQGVLRMDKKGIAGLGSI